MAAGKVIAAAEFPDLYLALHPPAMSGGAQHDHAVNHRVLGAQIRGGIGMA
jgi:hypothetical protein